jgi:hypothetical protein
MNVWEYSLRYYYSQNTPITNSRFNGDLGGNLIALESNYLSGGGVNNVHLDELWRKFLLSQGYQGTVEQMKDQYVLNTDSGFIASTVLSNIEWDQVSYPLIPVKVNDVWQSDFDPDDYLPRSYFSGTPLFVDFTTGSDAANGQAGTPVKSLWRAINLINTAGVPTHVTVTPGTFPRANWFNSGSVVLTTPAWFEVVGGEALAYNGDVLTWPGSPDATYTNTYKSARSNVSRVVNLLTTSAYGNHYVDFTKVADAATCNSTVNSWAQVGSDLYVNRGGAVTNANTRAYLTTNGLRTSASLRLTGFNIEGGGGLGGCLHILDIVEGVVIVEDCSLRYPGSDAAPRDCWFSDDSSGLIAFINTDFSSSSKDGGNAHWTNDALRQTYVLTIGCSGNDFGRGASTSNNAITAHETVVWLDIEGDYAYARGTPIRNINDSRMGKLGGSVSYDLGDGGGFTPSVVRVDNTAENWFVDVTITSAGENTLLTADDGVNYIHDVTQIGGVAAGDTRLF